MGNQILNRVTRGITIVLMVLMTMVVVLSTLDLSRYIYRSVTTPPYFFIEVETLMDIFGMFLLVLIGIELLDTVRAYLTEHVVHEEVILVAALIAVARKVIVLDVKELDALKLIGIGVIIITVAAAYWIVKRKHARNDTPQSTPPSGNTLPAP